MDAHRAPAVAGRFYPGQADALIREVDRLVTADVTPTRARVVVAPHAGYVYSGAIAGETYARVEVPDRTIVLCPNHTGLGARRSVWPSGRWDLPGGSIEVDAELAAAVIDSAALDADHDAHLHEHAIEVHLPFLRARNPNVRVVPVCLAGLSLDACRSVGDGLARAIRDAAEDVLIVSSTDMSHYISADDARALDELALARIVALDPEGLYETVRRHDISMCGYIPTTTSLFAARALGARAAKLVRYGNSGETSGDFDRVVGYAGLVVT